MKKLTKKELKHFKEVFARFGDDTVVRCKQCGRTQYLKFGNGLRNGWSLCHGKTMPIIYQQADIDKATGNIVSEAFSKMVVVK